MKIVLSGYFGFGNAGDEMIHEVLKERLMSGGHIVTSLVKNPEREDEIDRNNFREIYSTLKRSDILISGGGGLLQDKTSSRSLYYYLWIIRTAQKLHKKTAILAQGIGPINNAINKKIIGRIINKVDLITVRDEVSKEILEECGVRQDIYVTGDLGFLYKGYENGFNDRGFVIASFGKHPNPPSFETIMNILNFVTVATGLSIYLVPLYPAQDLEISNKIKEVTGFKILTLPYKALPSLFKKSELAIGTRYHLVVLSISNGVPCITFSYDPKVSSISQEAGISVLPYNSTLPFEKFKEIFKREFDMRENKKLYIRTRCKEFERRATRNFELLDETLLRY